MNAKAYSAEIEELLTVREVARICHLHEVTVRRHILQGRLKAVKIGKAVRVRREDFDRYTESHDTDVEQPQDRRPARPFTLDDPLFGLAGIGLSGGGVAEDKKAALAEIFRRKQ
jgi:excisionase family DNA binding protein